jgi:hypothetical protein
MRSMCRLCSLGSASCCQPPPPPAAAYISDMSYVTGRLAYTYMIGHGHAPAPLSASASDQKARCTRCQMRITGRPECRWPHGHSATTAVLGGTQQHNRRELGYSTFCRFLVRCVLCRGCPLLPAKAGAPKPEVFASEPAQHRVPGGGGQRERLFEENPVC